VLLFGGRSGCRRDSISGFVFSVFGRTFQSPPTIVWPERLIEVFAIEHRDLVGQPRPQHSEICSLLMEQIATQNMAKPNKDSQTLGERFTFLATSYISHIKHEVMGRYILMPQVMGRAPTLGSTMISMEDFPRVKAVNPSDFWKFVKNALPPNKPMVARADKGGPEWMVKMIDGDNQHLLCIQLKSGVENYSMEEVIDELAKGPEAEITGKVSLPFRDMKSPAGINTDNNRFARTARSLTRKQEHTASS
jgi:hypothetical protein